MAIRFQIFLILLIGLISFLIPQSVLAATNTDSMVGYWKFDESSGTSATDSSGDGNTGTYVGSPTPSTDHPTMHFTDTRSLLFDSSTYINVTSGVPTTLLGGLPKTVTMWVKPTDLSNDIGFFFMGRTDGTGQGKTFRFHTDSVFDEDTFTNTPGYLTIDESSGYHMTNLKLSQNTWQFISVEYLAGTSWKICLNTSCESFSMAAQNLDSGVMRIGRGDWTTSYPMVGYIDDVRLYNRALSSTELTDLANGNHTSATWAGVGDSDWEANANWSTSATPDPYTKVTIASTSHDPILSSNIAVASLTINSGATFTVDCYTITYNDGGTLTNNGTLSQNCGGGGGGAGGGEQVSSSSTPSSCSDMSPSGTPDLFQIDTTSNKAKLYFTPIQGNTNTYTISYGYTPGDMRFGVEKSGNETGVITYTLNELTPDTNYYVRVRAKNGCSASVWSNEMKVMTTEANSEEGKRFYKDFATQVIAAITQFVSFN